MSKHTPGPWMVESIRGGPYWSVRGTTRPHRLQIAKVSPGICACAGGSLEHGAANARLIAAAPDLLEALKGALSQLTGPVMVWGDGRGNDGKKTGLSYQEFNALRDHRIEAARAALAKAEA